MTIQPTPQARPPAERPVTTRSAVLSFLLGAHPPTLSARDLVAAMEHLGIAESTTRVALSRMVAAGDLLRDGRTYTLSERLVERQRRQDAAIAPRTRDWEGDWELVVITETGRAAADRAALRTTFTRLRLAELREGVWLRPANLERSLPASLDGAGRRLPVGPVDEAASLVAELWDLPAWAGRAEDLLVLAATDDPADRFAAMAMSVRHLLTDPVLPPTLTPPDWPGGRLRAAYDDYRRWLISLQPGLRADPAIHQEERTR